jgi:hypothetical protein
MSDQGRPLEPAEEPIGNPWETNADLARPWRREPECHICGRRRSQCQAHRLREIARGVPDPHEFETREEAEMRAEYAARRRGGRG